MDADDGFVLSAAFLRDTWVAFGTFRGNVWLRHPVTGEDRVVAASVDWGECVLCLSVLPDGRLVSGNADGSVESCDPATGHVQTMAQHDHIVTSVAALPGGQVVSGSYDHKVRFWDPAAASVRTVNEHRSRVVSILTLSDGRVVSRSDDKIVKLWDSAGRETITMVEPQGAGGATAGWTAIEGDKLLLVRRSGGVALVDVALSLVAVGTLPAQPTEAVAWHPDRRQIAVGTTRGVAVVELRPLPRRLAIASESQPSSQSRK